MKPDLWTSNNESAWRRKIGMSKKDDHRPPHERIVFLRRLKGLVEQRMLHFFQDEKPDPETIAERAPTWTPIPWICHNLEISHSQLSRLFRELLGLNVIQFYDKLKLTETQSILKYIALIREFVAAHSIRSGGTLAADCVPQNSTAAGVPPLLQSSYSGNGSKHFWKWLKEQRHNPDFDRQALAREFDFPSAARLHRAYFFATNSTPREFENLIIRQAIDDPKALEETIAHYTPQPQPLESLGITQLHPEQLFSPEPEAINNQSPINNPESPLPLPVRADNQIAPAAEELVVMAKLLSTFSKRKQRPSLPPPEEGTPQ